jgi:hypothetical protein
MRREEFVDINCNRKKKLKTNHVGDVAIRSKDTVNTNGLEANSSR